MTYKNILKHALDYGHKQLKAEVDIEAFFKTLPMPKGHFSRLFHAAYGMTFSHYIRRLKQTHAIQAYLKSYDISAIKLYGFESLQSLKSSFGLANQDSLNEAFLKAHKQMPDMSLPELIHLDSPILTTVEAKDFLGIPYHGHHPDKAIDKNWQRLKTDKLKDKRHFIQNKYYGLMAPIRDQGFDLINPKTGVYSYMCAKEMIAFGHFPKEFKYRMLPRRTYAIFKHHGPLDSLKNTCFSIYAEALFEAKLEYDEDYVFEVFKSDTDNDKQSVEIDIYIPVKP